MVCRFLRDVGNGERPEIVASAKCRGEKNVLEGGATLGGSDGEGIGLLTLPSDLIGGPARTA